MAGLVRRRRPRGELAAHYVTSAAALRSALYESVTHDDFVAVVRALVGAATTGDVPAAKLLLNYLLGRPLTGAAAAGLDAGEVDADVGPLQAQVAAWLAGMRPGAIDPSPSQPSRASQLAETPMITGTYVLEGAEGAKFSSADGGALPAGPPCTPTYTNHPEKYQNLTDPWPPESLVGLLKPR